MPTTPRAAPPLRLALAGCGHVGGGLLDLLREQDAPVHVQRVLVRDAQRARPALTAAIDAGLAPRDACITDPAQLLGDDIDVLIEVIGGTGTARELVDAALSRGIRVVTANKALLGERGAALQRAADEVGVSLDFEGAVCGAIPIVRCLRHGAAGVGVTRITGILNGTSNFVLEEVTAGASFDDAVATAQRLGYAEADPTRDLNGQDAEDKLRVLAWLAFGVEPAALTVERHGLDATIGDWATTVAADGGRVKLIASCWRDATGVHGHIAPTRVDAADPWARVTGPSNRLVVDSASAGALIFEGPGAGGRATAGAVLSDLLGTR